MPSFQGFYLGFAITPSSLAVFVALGVHTPVQISAGGEKLVWFVYEIHSYLNCYCARVKPLCFSVYIVFMPYLYYKVY